MESMEMRKCCRCKQLLPIDCFYYVNGKRKRWYSDCKKCLSETRKARRKNDPEYQKRLSLNTLNWQRNHKKQVNERTRRSYQKNIVKRRKYYSIYRRAKYCKDKHDPVFRMLRSHRCRIQKILRYNFVKKPARTMKLFGCSAVQLKDYLAGKFTAGMTWENHGSFGWHVDHIKPLASFNFRVEAQIMAAFHYTNLQPLWWYENLKKSDKVAVA